MLVPRELRNPETLRRLALEFNRWRIFYYEQAAKVVKRSLLALCLWAVFSFSPKREAGFPIHASASSYIKLTLTRGFVCLQNRHWALPTIRTWILIAIMNAMECRPYTAAPKASPAIVP